MLADRNAPIVAIATASGRGAVGIVRVSGPHLEALTRALCGRSLTPRQATLLPFLDAQGQTIDRGLAIFFPAPHSYTGEDVLELQAHGGPVVLQLLLARCLQAAAETDATAEPATGPTNGSAIAEASASPSSRPRVAGLRLAEPGEFTQRAFLNGKLDLTQAEAVADLIDAGTEAAARSAARAVDGAFSVRVDALADATVELRALVEATLDFPEEEIDFLQQADARGRLRAIRADLDALLATARQGALLREGLQVVIAGQPNVGKSSLLNALAGAELAIVTPIPGTTRDRVSGSIQIEGVPVHVTDTAGLRRDEQATDEVERIGIGRSWQAIRGADCVLFLHDLTRAGCDPAYDAAEREIEREIAAGLPPNVAVIHVGNKVDALQAARLEPASGDTAAQSLEHGLLQTLPQTSPGAKEEDRSTGPDATVPTVLQLSARTGHGLQALRQRLLDVAGWQPGSEGIVIARERHLQALRQCGIHLDQAARHLEDPDPPLDLLAEELRLAHHALGEITGVFTTEDLLGEIFGRFCIGK